MSAEHRVPSEAEYRAYLNIGLTEEIKTKIKELLKENPDMTWQEAVDKIREDSKD